MAHFARLNEKNEVVEIIVVSNDVLMDNGSESEAKGIAFCQRILGADTRWVQTSYNGSSRGLYAGIGMIYDADKDVFIDPDAPAAAEPRKFFEHL